VTGHSLVPLRDLILESQNGLSKRSGADGTETPVLRLADITAGAIDESDPREIRLTAKELAKYALQHGDLVCIRVNGSKALVGRVIQFRANRVWAYCDHFIRLRPNQALVDHRYLAHYFNSQTVRRHIELNMVSSAGQNTVSQGTMLDIPVPCPELETQREIVAELEKQFSRLDEAVANLQRVKANLKRYKASVLKAAVEGRLVETEATLAHREGRTYETGEKLLSGVVVDRKAHRAAKGKTQDAAISAVIYLPELAGGWAWASVEEVGRLQLGRQRAPKYHAGANMRPYLRVQNVFEDRIDLSDVMEMEFSEADFERFELHSGDVLLNEGQSPEFLGRPAIYRNQLPGACFTNTLIRFQAYRCVLPEFALIFFRHCMHSGRFAKESNITTNIAHLSLGRLAAVEFPVPPLAEQQRIVFEFDRQMSIVREVEAEVGVNIRRAQALRQATLVKFFSPAID
jgi:type I restriction enzyme S subunit